MQKRNDEKLLRVCRNEYGRAVMATRIACDIANATDPNNGVFWGEAVRHLSNAQQHAGDGDCSKADLCVTLAVAALSGIQTV